MFLFPSDERLPLPGGYHHNPGSRQGAPDHLRMGGTYRDKIQLLESAATS